MCWFIREIVNEKVPYREMDLETMIEEIGKNENHRLPIPTSGKGLEFKNLIEKCLHRNPIYRPNFKDVLTEINKIKKRIFKHAHPHHRHHK